VRGFPPALLLALLACFASPAFAQTPIDAALMDRARPQEHRLRDETRGVRAILEAAKVQPGERVLDMGSGGGYLALIFSALVGDTGHVDAHNTPGWIAQFPGMDPDALKARIGRPNIGYVVSRWDDLPNEPASYDLIVLGQVYHDALLEAADVGRMNAQMFALLKPGGRVVIEDHDADPTMPLGKQVGLHRIARDAVVAQMQASGFQMASMAVLPSGHDDYRFNVFRPGIRGRTDRFIAVFVKPG
jgi:predicted methyltransferase